FWKNEFGEEVFTYPGSQLLTDKLLGVPIPLTGRVEGLSMFGSVVPGLGPAAQIPVGWFLETKPGPQAMKAAIDEIIGTELPGPLGTVEDQLLPFGSIAHTDLSEIAALEGDLRPWLGTASKAATTPDSDQACRPAVMSVAGYLRTTGEYGTARAETQRLMDDARRKA